MTASSMTASAKSRSEKPEDLTGRSFLRAYTKAQSRLLMLSVVSGSFATVLLIFQCLLFAFLAQQTIVHSIHITEQVFLIGSLLVTVIARALLTRLKTHFAQNASLFIRKSLRLDILTRWRNTSPLLLNKKSAGASATQWVEEVESMDGYFSRYWPQQALALISPLMILCVVAYLNWFCALLLLISAPLIPLFMILVGMGAEKINQDYSTLKQRLAGHFFDRVANLSTIKMLGAQQSVFKEVETRSSRYREVVMKTLRVAFLSSTVLEFFTSVAIASLAIYIGFSLYGAIAWGPASTLTLFTGLGILLLAPEFFQPLRILSQYYHDRAGALGAANNLIELFAHDDSPIASGKVKKLVDEQHKKHSFAVVARDLSIGHTESAPIVKHLDFSLEVKHMLAVSGQSGCGKSTLLNAIASYLPVLGGEISFADADKTSIAYLPQKPWIKNASIYENLIALAPDATQSQMHEVLDSLGLSNELSLSHDGLDTVIGEHGQGLSGGQMQRIALARVLLNPAEIVLLDEPTAKLDLLSKRYVLDALKRLQQSATLIVATHDPQLIDTAELHIDLDKHIACEGDDAVLV